MRIDTDVAPPARIKSTKRLTDAMRNLGVGQSFLTDQRTALAYRSYCSYHGQVCQQQKEGKQYRVWRLQ